MRARKLSRASTTRHRDQAYFGNPDEAVKCLGFERFEPLERRSAGNRCKSRLALSTLNKQETLRRGGYSVPATVTQSLESFFPISGLSCTRAPSVVHYGGECAQRSTGGTVTGTWLPATAFHEGLWSLAGRHLGVPRSQWRQ